jgi:hypothetical protein
LLRGSPGFEIVPELTAARRLLSLLLSTPKEHENSTLLQAEGQRQDLPGAV